LRITDSRRPATDLSSGDERTARGYRFGVKRVIPFLIAAVVAVLAVVRLREENSLPETPEGSWKLADDEPST